MIQYWKPCQKKQNILIIKSLNSIKHSSPLPKTKRLYSKITLLKKIMKLLQESMPVDTIRDILVDVYLMKPNTFLDNK